MNLSVLNKIISISFYLLFFLTPLVWTSKNFELFEYNKMILVYALTVVITGSWLLKMLQEKSFVFKRTVLDIPLLLFFAANVLSTLFSIDPHTSIWGYYSRSNGGLLSLISYLLLYFAFVSNIEPGKTLKYLKAAIFSGVIISIWGILEHFGASLSCVILRGQANDTCWIQDVQARVFATLGQPNWLAAYLAMLIFPAIYFLLTASTNFKRITYFLSLTALYTAFTFTYSRGPTLGLLAGFAIILFFQLLRFDSKGIRVNKLPLPLAAALAVFVTINILFGSALTNFRLVSKFAPPPRPSINIPSTPSGTQLENGGTESGQIRLIVWQGAWDIFKHNPIFGTGVETFAYSYYQFRPVAHNLTSEWDFLYNKAHNEFLNYLATTGLVGFLAYISIIVTFIVFSIRYLVSGIKKYEIRNTKYEILVAGLLAAYVSFLIQAFFLFSVVITSVFFFLFPAIVFTATQSTKPINLSSILQVLYRRPVYTKLAKIFVALSTIYLIFSISQYWYADTLFTIGERASDSGNPGRAYNLLSEASDINSGEPFYRSELGFAAASAAAALGTTDATLSAGLVKRAVAETDTALETSPKNVSYWRTAIRTYFELSTLDQQAVSFGNQKYIDKTLTAVDKTISLAPTDPKLYLSKATILESTGKNGEAKLALQKAIELKPNYFEAYISLAHLYIEEKNYDQALNILKANLKILPNDPAALNLLVELGKAGVSTESAATR